MDDIQQHREKLRDELLLVALPHVVFDGWGLKALTAGAKSIGFQEGYPHALFTDPGRELVAHFSDWADRKMLEQLSKTSLTKLKVRDRISLSVRYRFEVISDYREAFRKSLIHSSPLLLYTTVDKIWRNTGDLSVDFNFYSKRVLLAAVISSSSFFWLTDTSENYSETWKFIDRRIEDVMLIPKLHTEMKKLLSPITKKLKPTAC
tara:strand:- start:3311 stop:3925 length:615 start_codon:yes stop_codon:yes gene_type:complete